MSLPRICSILLLATVFSLNTVAEAYAYLYGFTHYNPYTKQERNLSWKETPLHLQNYRADMRENLLMLIRYANQQNPDFKIIVHNGQDLLTKSLWEYSRDGYNTARHNIDIDDEYFLFHHKDWENAPERGTPAYEYLHKIDAIAIDNFYCGNGKFTDLAKKYHLDLITIEQCPDQSAVDGAKASSMLDKKAVYAFSDLDTAFNSIGDYDMINDSAKNIYNISDAQNILILNDDSHYKTQEQLVDDLSKTNYDILVIKPLFAYHQRFSVENLKKLHFKKNGSKRLLIAEFNVSEANPREYYWLDGWHIGTPDWLIRPSFSSPDNIITKFWRLEWQKIISRYFKDVLNEGFDGVFFTGVENYNYFEQQNPLE